MKYFPKTMTPLSVAIGMSVLAGHASAQVLPVSDVHCQVMQDSNTLNPQGPVGCDRLRLVTFPFASLDGPDGEGSVMVMDAFAEQVDDLFIALYQRRFPLQTALGMEHFNGDDAASMAANNTSAFNGRVIEGSTNWSLHAYGAAIDLNPVQNPFLAIAVDGTASIDPVVSARSYVNRMSVRAEKPVRVGMAEEVIDLFAERGFLHWGGYWNYPVDYQHFEVAPRRFIEYLANAEPEQAREDFQGYVQMYGGCMAEEAVLEHAAQRAQCVGRVLDYYRQWPL